MLTCLVWWLCLRPDFTSCSVRKSGIPSTIVFRANVSRLDVNLASMVSHDRLQCIFLTFVLKRHLRTNPAVLFYVLYLYVLDIICVICLFVCYVRSDWCWYFVMFFYYTLVRIDFKGSLCPVWLWIKVLSRRLEDHHTCSFYVS